jgi:DNA-binding transcriptional ArsR family regulator
LTFVAKGNTIDVNPTAESMAKEAGSMAKVRRPRTDQLEEGAGVGKLMGDALRLRILSVVAFDGPVSVGEVCRAVNVPQPSASHHLGILRMAKLVEGRRAGKNVIYSVAKGLASHPGVQALRAMLAKLAG